MCEFTFLRNWVKTWLKYVKWYSAVALDPEVKLDAFFDAPMDGDPILEAVKAR